MRRPSTIVSTRPRRRRSAAARGTAALELALVLPLLLLLAVAATDFGRIVHAYVVVSNAARCGAEYAAMHKTTDYTRDHWEEQIQEAVESEMQGLNGFDSDDLAVSISTTTDSSDLTVTRVEVTYPFQTAVSWPGIPSQVVMRHDATMRQIR